LPVPFGKGINVASPKRNVVVVPSGGFVHGFAAGGTVAVTLAMHLIVRHDAKAGD